MKGSITALNERLRPKKPKYSLLPLILINQEKKKKKREKKKYEVREARRISS